MKSKVLSTTSLTSHFLFMWQHEHVTENALPYCTATARSLDKIYRWSGGTICPEMEKRACRRLKFSSLEIQILRTDYYHHILMLVVRKWPYIKITTPNSY